MRTTSRALVAILVFALLGGVLWWTEMPEAASPSAPVSTGWFTVYVVGADGARLAAGSVTSIATPYGALRQLADEQGFPVETEQQTWIGGGCTATYVVGIAGQHETTSGGWNYYTRGPDSEWVWGPDGSACHALHLGDQVEWCWVESDVCRHHVG